VVSILASAALNFLLQLSTFVTVSSGVLFAFVLVVAVSMCIAAATLQTAGLALASLFGSDAVQAVISGQAAVGVVVSLARLLSTVASLDTSPPRSDESETNDWSSTFFFGFSTLFSLCTLEAYWRIARTKEYKQIMSSAVLSPNLDNEARPLIDGPPSSDSLELPEELLDEPMKPVKMLLLNKYLNFAVACVFIVTLVSIIVPFHLSSQT